MATGAASAKTRGGHGKRANFARLDWLDEAAGGLNFAIGGSAMATFRFVDVAVCVSCGLLVSQSCLTGATNHAIGTVPQRSDTQRRHFKPTFYKTQPISFRLLFKIKD